MRYATFDIILVDFPFTNLTVTKKRPALVVKSLEGDNIIVSQITTKMRKIQKYEVRLQKSSCLGDIRFDSFIYLDTIFTLHRDLIHRKIAEISSIETRKSIHDKLKELFFLLN